ncbi:MAG: hypothetical protein RL642_1037, partial [Bacteroidota bacterium]
MEQFQKGLVSIIIPVFNRASLLPETLDSIVSQTYSNWECIIVDDGSTDSSLNVALGYAKKDNRFKVYSRPWYKKKGANSCRNYGFKLSKGEFIQWFDSDDLMFNIFISEKIKAFQNNEIDIIACDQVFCPEVKQECISKNNLLSRSISSNLAFVYLVSGFFFQTSQVAIRREKLLTLDYIFTEKLMRNQETELYVRFLLKNLKRSYIDMVLLKIRLDDQSISC